MPSEQRVERPRRRLAISEEAAARGSDAPHGSPNPRRREGQSGGDFVIDKFGVLDATHEQVRACLQLCNRCQPKAELDLRSVRQKAGSCLRENVKKTMAKAALARVAKST